MFIIKKELMKSLRYREDNCLVYIYFYNILISKYKCILCLNVFIYLYYFKNSNINFEKVF